jgi:hypothetical protein
MANKKDWVALLQTRNGWTRIERMSEIVPSVEIGVWYGGLGKIRFNLIFQDSVKKEAFYLSEVC